MILKGIHVLHFELVFQVVKCSFLWQFFIENVNMISRPKLPLTCPLHINPQILQVLSYQLSLIDGDLHDNCKSL